MSRSDSMKGFWFLAFLAAIFVFALPALTILGLHAFAEEGFSPEIVLPVLLIAGVVALLGAIALVTLTYGRFKLTDRTQPLALPEGSVRAIIALLLILIFAIVGLFLFASLFNGKIVEQQLTKKELRALPTDAQVLARTAQPDGTFLVKMSLPPDESSLDFSKQLLTTISTLVVAISAFYFGTQSAAQAQPGPDLELVTPPESPSTLPETGTTMSIVLRPTPSDAGVSGEIVVGEGDLEAIGGASFEYQNPRTDQKKVVLKFALDAHPERVVYLELLPPDEKKRSRHRRSPSEDPREPRSETPQ